MEKADIRVFVENVIKEPNAYKEKWEPYTKDLPSSWETIGIIFLGEVLSALDNGQDCNLEIEIFTETDMMGGMERKWTLSTEHFTIKRHYSQQINDSWQSIDTTKNVFITIGFDDNPVGLSWKSYTDDDFADKMDFVLTNVPAEAVKKIRGAAKALYKKSKIISHGRSVIQNPVYKKIEKIFFSDLSHTYKDLRNQKAACGLLLSAPEEIREYVGFKMWNIIESQYHLKTLRGLACLKYKKALPALEHRFYHEIMEQKAHIAHTIHLIAGRKGDFERFNPMKGYEFSKYFDTRLMVIDILKDYDVEPAKEALYEKISDTDPKVRLAACRSLLAMRGLDDDPKRYPEIYRILNSKPTPPSQTQGDDGAAGSKPLYHVELTEKSPYHAAIVKLKALFNSEEG